MEEAEGTATAVAEAPKKKAKAKVKKPKAKAKKAKVAKKSKGGGEQRGKPSKLVGKKLFKVNANKHGLRESGRRFQTYKSIKDGVSYEKFVANGGNTADLNNLLVTGKVRAKA